EEAMARLRRALEEYTVTGIKTNAALFQRILHEPEFQRGEVHTKWLDERLRPSDIRLGATDGSDEAADAAAIAAALWQATRSRADHTTANHSASEPSRWKLEARREQVDRRP